MNESTPSVEKHLTVCKSEQTILDCLSENCPQISRQKLKLAMKYGAVWLTPKAQNNQSRNTIRIRRAKKLLQKGDQVHLYYNEAILFSEFKPARLVSDEGEYSIWDKPCGMFSQGTKWGDHTAITRWVELFGLSQNDLLERSCFLVHRLDRATSGLIIVAHSKKAAQLLSELFENRKIDKQYSVRVKGQYPSATTMQRLTRDIDGKSAATIVISSEYLVDKNQTSLILKIDTGRKHQIRKHLSEVGYAIIGDRLYGEYIINGEGRSDLMLKSCYLAFECPITQNQMCYQLSVL